MKPKSKSIERLVSSDKPATAQFGQVSESVWRVSGKTMTIDEFIEDQARHVNSIDISVLGAFSGRLLDKLEETNAVEYPGLQEAVQSSSGSWNHRRPGRRKIHCRAGWQRLALLQITS
jgi:hypothetical protein